MDNLEQYIQSAPLVAILFSYLGGVLTSFTPCIFPMIPITVSVIGSKEQTSRMQAFLLALLYVVGLACMYAALGLLAAVTGKLFGRVSAHPITNLIVANIFLFFALSMFEVVDIPLPRFLTNRKITTGKQRGFLSAFMMGIASGTVAAPCTAPVLGTLLTFVAQSHNLIYGSVLLFVFAFGMGTLLILIGTFSGILASLPKAEGWLTIIKRILALLMIVVAEYFFIKAGQAWL